MSEWIAPTRKAFVAACAPPTRRAARFRAGRNLLFVPIDFPRSAPFTPATGNNQYRSYLARIGACVRLLATLRKDATRKRKNAQHADAARDSSRDISARRVDMKRRAFLKRAAAGVAATALASPALAQTGAPVRWRLATSWPKSLDTVHGTIEAMSQRVAQLTDRKFEIQVFASGEIVPPLQVWDATQSGTIECGHTLTAFYIGKNPAVAFDSGVAFGLNTRQQQAWMYSGGGLELMRSVMRSTPSKTSKDSSSGSAGSAA
jgi:Bacterial extracellular solute-binding protein, family 7